MGYVIDFVEIYIGVIVIVLLDVFGVMCMIKLVNVGNVVVVGIIVGQYG